MDTIGRVRFGVLGYGKIARARFLPALAGHPSAILAAIATRDPVAISTETFPVSPAPRIVTYDELIREGRSLVDAVYIALPNDLHEEWTISVRSPGQVIASPRIDRGDQNDLDERL